MNTVIFDCEIYIVMLLDGTPMLHVQYNNIKPHYTGCPITREQYSGHRFRTSTSQKLQLHYVLKCIVFRPSVCICVLTMKAHNSMLKKDNNNNSARKCTVPVFKWWKHLKTIIPFVSNWQP